MAGEPVKFAPCDIAAVERVLCSDPVLYAGLERLREILDIADWQRSPLAAPFQAAACALAAFQLVESGEHSPYDALPAAAIMLKIAPDTALSRARRWPQQSRKGCRVHHAASCTGNASPASSSLLHPDDPSTRDAA